MDIFLTVLFAGLFISFIVLDIMSIRRWPGVWRILAVLPGIALIAVILNIVIAIVRDPTAHNLWPLEIVMWCAGGLAFLGLLLLVRKIMNK